MLRISVWLGLGVALLCGAGCAADGGQRDPQFQLHKVESERDALAGRLSDEQARGAAFQKRIETQEIERNADRATMASLREHVDQLTRDNGDLRKLVEDRKNRPVTRPAVPVSALPPAVDEALQAFAAKLPDRVSYDRGRAAISFANEKLFESGGAEVRPEAQPTLKELARILAATPEDEFEIIVVGHTDDQPIRSAEVQAQHATNWHLSVHRAIGVKDVLVAGGLPQARLGVMGYGEYRPISEDRARNRRVEIFVTRKGAPQVLQPVQTAGPKR